MALISAYFRVPSGRRANSPFQIDCVVRAGGTDATISGGITWALAPFMVPFFVNGTLSTIIPATQRALLWGSDTPIKTMDIQNHGYVVFIVPGTPQLQFCLQEDWATVWAATDVCRVAWVDLHNDLRPRLSGSPSRLPKLTMLAGDYVHLFGTSQDDYYGHEDHTNDLDYIASGSYPMFATVPVANNFGTGKTVSKQRIAKSADEGPVLAIAPNGTLWSTPDAGTTPGSLVGVPDFISALNSGFTDPLGHYTIANFLWAEGITYGDGKWWLLLVEEQHLISDISPAEGVVVEKRVKVFTSTVAVPSVDTDWTEYRVIFAGYTTGGYFRDFGAPRATFIYTSHLITGIGWDFTGVSNAVVRGTDGTLTILSSVFSSVSDINAHTIGMNNDGTVVTDGGDVTLHSYEVGTLGTNGSYNAVFGNTSGDYFSFSGPVSSPTSFVNQGPMFTTSGGSLHFNSPQTVPDYSTSGTPSVGGYYTGSFGPCGFLGYATAIKTDDITDISLFSGYDDPLGGFYAVIALAFTSSTSRTVHIVDAAGVEQSVSSNYGHGFEGLTASLTGCEGFSVSIVHLPPRSTFAYDWRASIVGEVSVWGIGVGGVVLRRVRYESESIGNTNTWTNMYIDYGVSSTGIIGETTSDMGLHWDVVDGDQSFPFLEHTSGYVDMSFDGDNQPPVRIGFAAFLRNGAYGSHGSLIDPLPGAVLGLCDDGADGAYAIIDDNNLYHLIEDPANPGHVMIDGSAVATGVIASEDSVQFMRRRANGDIIGCHGQSGANQAFVIRGSTVTQGDPFSFPSPTYNNFFSEGSAGFEQSVGFSTAIAL